MTTSPSVRLADVAKRARVSLSTASRVLNGSARQVTPDLVDRVMASAAALGYTPNAQAQALARSASSTVGLIIHDVTDQYFSAIANGVIRIADSRGLLVMLGTTFRDPRKEIDFAAMLHSQRVRAMILVGTRQSSRALTARLAAVLKSFQAAGGRVSAVTQARLPIDTVVPENRAGARKLARELVKLGHREFAALTASHSLLTCQDRLAGFRDGLADSGLRLPDESVFEGALTRDGGYAAAQQMVDKGVKASCLFVVTDVMAVGAVTALRERGIRVPEDLSVAGFDDIETLRDLTPPLTTVRLQLEEMGARAARLALDPSPPGSPQVIRYPGEVVLRASTRRLS